MRIMSRNKEQEKKKFLIAKRKRIGSGFTNAPVWVMQKAGKRIWNPKQLRNWRETSLGKQYRKKKKE